MKNDSNRRTFLKQSGLAASALALGSQSSVMGQGKPAGPKLRVGIVGCRGRSYNVGEMALADGRFEIVALADYFQEAVDTIGEKYQVPARRRYTGLHCYKRLIDAGEL